MVAFNPSLWPYRKNLRLLLSKSLHNVNTSGRICNNQVFRKRIFTLIMRSEWTRISDAETDEIYSLELFKTIVLFVKSYCVLVCWKLILRVSEIYNSKPTFTFGYSLRVFIFYLTVKVYKLHFASRLILMGYTKCYAYKVKFKNLI